MNKLLLRAISKTIRACAESIEDYQHEYRHLPTATDVKANKLLVVRGLLRDAIDNLYHLIEGA